MRDHTGKTTKRRDVETKFYTSIGNGCAGQGTGYFFFFIFVCTILNRIYVFSCKLAHVCNQLFITNKYPL